MTDSKYNNDSKWDIDLAFGNKHEKLIGDLLTLNKDEIEVKAEAEDIVTGIRTVTATAFVTFVALDQNGKPMPVSKLYLKTVRYRQP